MIFKNESLKYDVETPESHGSENFVMLESLTTPSPTPFSFSFESLPYPIESTVFPLPSGRVLAAKRGLIVAIVEGILCVLVYKQSSLKRTLPLDCPLIKSNPTCAEIADFRKFPELLVVGFTCGSLAVFEISGNFQISLRRVLNSSSTEVTHVDFLGTEKIISSTAGEISVHSFGLLVNEKTKILDLPSTRLGNFRRFVIGNFDKFPTLVGLLFVKAALVAIVSDSEVRVVWKSPGEISDMLLLPGTSGPSVIARGKNLEIPGKEISDFPSEDRRITRLWKFPIPGVLVAEFWDERKKAEVVSFVSASRLVPMAIEGRVLGVLFDRSLLIRSTRGGVLVTIQPWGDFVKALLHQHRWEEVLGLCAGLMRGSLPLLLDDALSSSIVKAVLIGYVTANMRSGGEENTSAMIDRCLAMAQPSTEISAFVCDELGRFFPAEIFLARVEKFITCESGFKVDTETIKSVLLWLEKVDIEMEIRVERVLLACIRQDVNLDCDFVIRFCAKHDLTISLVLIHTHILADYRTPVKLLLPHKAMLLEYLTQTLRGTTFPFGVTCCIASPGKTQLTEYLFSDVLPTSLNKGDLLQSVLPTTAEYGNLVRQYWTSDTNLDDISVFLARVAHTTGVSVETPKKTLRALMTRKYIEISDHNELVKYVISKASVSEMSEAQEILSALSELYNTHSHRSALHLPLMEFSRRHVHLLPEDGKNFWVDLGMAEGRGDWERVAELFEKEEFPDIEIMSEILNRNCINDEIFARLVKVSMKDKTAAKILSTRNFRFPLDLEMESLRSWDNLAVVEHHAANRNRIFREVGNLTRAEILRDNDSLVRRKKTANIVYHDSLSQCVNCRRPLKGRIAVLNDGRTLHEACWSQDAGNCV